MERGPELRRPDTVIGFVRRGGNEATRVARALPPDSVIDAAELARVFEADELEVCEDHPSLDEGPRALAAEPADVGPLPLPKPRSLIPSDILEAIAAEEEALLAEEGRGETDVITIEIDDEVEVVRESLSSDEALALLEQAQIFRSFPTEALAMLSEGACRHHLGERQLAFSEGEPASSFFVVESGTVEAVRVSHDAPEVALAHLSVHEPFGLFGLLSRRTRCASVRAIGEAWVIEVSAAQLDEVIRTHPVARQALARFYQERLLENFLAVSPIFRNLDALGRAALISHFQDRRCQPGEQIVSPGEVQNGIFLVTSGVITVSRRSSPGRDSELARLTRGQFFGVVSALSGLPTRATITAVELTTLCCLPQKAFNDFVKGYPVLRALPARLTEAGTAVERDVFVGDATQLG